MSKPHICTAAIFNVYTYYAKCMHGFTLVFVYTHVHTHSGVILQLKDIKYVNKLCILQLNQRNFFVHCFFMLTFCKSMIKRCLCVCVCVREKLNVKENGVTVTYTQFLLTTASFMIKQPF